MTSPTPLSEEALREVEQWRDLALQFDGHRIEALAMLRYVSEATNVAGALGRIGEIKAFLAKPPLSGAEVELARLLSLRSETRASVIEECAKVADGVVVRREVRWTEDETGKHPYGGDVLSVNPEKIASAIRALNPSGGDERG